MFSDQAANTLPAPGEMAADPGLRAFLTEVHLRVIGGLVLSAALAWCVAFVPMLRDVFLRATPDGATFTPWGWAVVLAPVVVLIVAGLAVRDQTRRGVSLLYWTIAAMVGVSLSLLALNYAGATLVSTFLVTAGAFAGLTLWGYATRRNLAGLGSFLTVALFGLIIATIANALLRSAMLDLVLNLIGVLVFAGLIASDAQQLKRLYYQAADAEALEASASYGALTLYLNFINLFELLLSLSTDRSRR